MADEVEKVTDPEKQVTDPVLLELLARQGIDRDYVEFYRDYAPRFLNGERVKGKSPYAKFYRDLKSARRFMVVSGLPMVSPDGMRIDAGWLPSIEGAEGRYRSRPNLFVARVHNTRVTITVLYDQPDGRKANDELVFDPQLFLGKVEVKPVSAVASLIDDPLNPNYKGNVLEWDYGICRRRLRIIEGRLHGYWVFAANPGEEVRIKYNQTGDFKLKLGEFRVNDDEEKITPEQFDEFAVTTGYPVTIADSATFYPDADPETSSVDGQLIRFQTNGVSWSDIHDGAGTHAYDAFTTIYAPHWQDSYLQLFRYLRRGMALFDTSGLPDAATVTQAVLSLYGESKANDNGAMAVNNIYAATPASNTSLAPGDYQSFGTTPYADGIAYASWVVGAYNAFTLNATGRSAISKTGVSKFGIREASYDVANVAPPTQSGVSTNMVMSPYAAEQGAGYKPKLVVEYTIGPVAPTAAAQPASNIQPTSARLNGKIVDDGGETCEARFRWRKVGAADWNTTSWQNSLITDDTFFYDLSELAPDTGYEFQAQARNSVGESDWSASETFQTLFPMTYPGLRIGRGGATEELCVVATGEGVPGMGGIPKVRKGASTYDLYLVEVDDPAASPVRIKTPAGIKAIRRLALNVVEALAAQWDYGSQSSWHKKREVLIPASAKKVIVWVATMTVQFAYGSGLVAKYNDVEIISAAGHGTKALQTVVDGAGVAANLEIWMYPYNVDGVGAANAASGAWYVEQ